MKFLYLLDEHISRLEKILIAVLLTVMILMAFSQIVLRNFFSTGIAWGDALVRYLVVWVGFVGAAIAAKEGRHVQRRVAVVVGAVDFGSALDQVFQDLDSPMERGGAERR